MAILFISDSDSPTEWRYELQKLSPKLDFRVWPNIGTQNEIKTALVWKAPSGALTNLRNLTLIQSLGAGIDHILLDPKRPRDVPIARLVDKELTRQMVEYAVLAVLNRHRRMDELRESASQQKWQVLPPTTLEKSRIGILGLGEIGLSIAQTIKTLGFSVQGWSQNPKQIDGIKCYHGPAGLQPLLSTASILICALPLTQATRGILNRNTMSSMPQDAYLVNLARGEHLIEKDLLELVDNGHLAGAFLDVFEKEPLPYSHPFWKHPKITVTPHLAGLTIAASAAKQVVENIRLVSSGKPPLHQVDPKRGY